jgi:ParB family chromosome partitioning protein
MIECFAFTRNLHRAELSALERDEQVALWVHLSAEKVRQLDEPLPGGRQPNEKGQSKAARELGISEPDARRAVRVAGLSDEAKQVAREVGLDDNRAALLVGLAAA